LRSAARSTAKKSVCARDEIAPAFFALALSFETGVVSRHSGGILAGLRHVAGLNPRQRRHAGADTFTDEEAQAEAVVSEVKPFTAKQGQYLAYIYYYTKIHRRPPAESDLQRFFRVTPPVVHQMIKTLEARGFIDRQPGAARSIRLRLTRAQLPDLE
jgi:DNA-binding MarR family transcriptional regulator